MHLGVTMKLSHKLFYADRQMGQSSATPTSIDFVPSNWVVGSL